MKGFSFTEAHDYPYTHFWTELVFFTKKKKKKEREREKEKQVWKSVKMTKLAIKRVCHIQASLYSWEIQSWWFLS